jgi:PAS domain-containing protein
MTDQDIVQAVISVCKNFELPITLADPDAPDCPLIFASKRFVKMTGYDEDDLIGSNCRILQGFQTDKYALRRLAVACERRAKYSCCLLNYKKDGTAFHNFLTLEPIMVSKSKTLLLGAQYAFDRSVTPKQVRYQVEYITILLRSIYRVTQSDQKLLAQADKLRAERIRARSEGAFFLISNYLSQLRTLDAIAKSYDVLSRTQDISRNIHRRSA